MTSLDQLQGLELRSTISSDGRLEVKLRDVPVAEPASHEVVVRIEATPLNPSDLALLLGPADLATMTVETGEDGRPTLRASIPAEDLPSVRGRLGQSLPVGNEGAGTIVRAGEAVAHMVGQRVGVLGGGMYTRYRTIAAAACLELPESVAPEQGASMFVNPLTALAMVETMRREGHRALVHTAAASNLGRMLVRLCTADGIPLVNIVRSSAQVDLLRAAGAQHIVNSTADSFRNDLIEALSTTGATLAFDAIGGGGLAGEILHAMEEVALRSATGYNRYGSGVFKQVYIYGSLDTEPTVLDRSFGFDWNVSGFLLTPFLTKLSSDDYARLRARARDHVSDIFKSEYAATVSLTDVLAPANVSLLARKETGGKLLIDPSLA